MKPNLLTIVAIILMLSSLLFAIGYYFYLKNYQCEQAPFVYGAKKYEQELFNVKVVGTVYILPLEDKATRPSTLFFNSSSQILQP